MAETSASRARKRPPRKETTPNADAASKGSTGNPETPDLETPTPVKRTPADRKLAASVAGTYQAIGMGMIGIGMRIEDAGLVGTGTATVNGSEQIAEAWLDLADKNPQVKKALKKFTEVSAAGTLIGLHITLLIPILIDRKVIPEPFGMMAAGFTAGVNGNGANN